MTPKELMEIKKDLREKRQRVSAMADKLESEKRQRNEKEECEYQTLVRDIQICEMKLAAAEAEQSKPQRAGSLAGADDVLRHGRDFHHDVQVVLTRGIMTTAGLNDTGIIPVQEKEMLEPLREGLIWNKMGIHVESGLAGTLRWPLHGKATASWEGETTRVADSNIDFRKLIMNGTRLACAIPVSKTELNDSQGVVERAVRKEMPAACIDLINSSMLTLIQEEENAEGNKVDKTVYGPFAQKVSSDKFTGGCAVRTLATNASGDFTQIRKDLLSMIADVYSKGVAKKNPGFVMNENTAVILRDTKVDAGSGRFVMENDAILGYPVFTSSEVPDGVIGFGDWSYQAAGFFGEISMIIDPYTLARQFSTDFVLNMRFGTATLRKEAFVLGMSTAAQTALKTAIAAIGATA